ncbi:hypothetical protein GCM10012275_23950 [Longimycelium tulufanense]|uniref:Uncharacterized protein n=1 Tax=Longimycelium tulufanense TaxID=907463 RepID=A0A8J3CDR3_9PSEU|nr:hypothetical protein GCM10012275_23950 [Longimycelium tulufanense]
MALLITFVPDTAWAVTGPHRRPIVTDARPLDQSAPANNHGPHTLLTRSDRWLALGQPTPTGHVPSPGRGTHQATPWWQLPVIGFWIPLWSGREQYRVNLVSTTQCNRLASGPAKAQVSLLFGVISRRVVKLTLPAPSSQVSDVQCPAQHRHGTAGENDPVPASRDTHNPSSG